MTIDDGRPIDQEVDEENIKTITSINVTDRRYVVANTYYTNPFHPKVGQVETYMVFNLQVNGMSPPAKPTPTSQPNMSFVIHETRVLRFNGANTSKLETLRLAGWNHSRLQRPYEKVKAFAQAFQASGNLLTDASQGVYKLRDLHSQVAGNERGLLETRMMMLDMGRSVARAIVLDEEEEFERTIATISGYPEMLDRFMMLLSAATNIPVTLLMGRSAAGMNATGDSDFRQFYDFIESRQTEELHPNLHKVYRLICLAKDGPTGGAETELEFHFHSLWSPTLAERAVINQTQSVADMNYITAGVLTGEEVALSRFRTGALNLSTKIDMKARQQAQAAGKLFDPYHGEPGETAGGMDLKNQHGAPPAPVAPPGTSSVGGRGGKSQMSQQNSTQPGNKSGAGK
jgi:phage-related protein (TIGR01555 family)